MLLAVALLTAPVAGAREPETVTVLGTTPGGSVVMRMKDGFSHPRHSVEIKECRPPNAFLADPPLDEVVAKNFDLGVRARGQAMS